MNKSRSLNISPMLPSADQRDERFRYTVLGGDGALRHANVLPNCHDVVRGQLGCGAAPRVLSRSDRLQVSGVDTASVSAEVIYLHSSRYGADQLFVNPAMRVVANATASDLAVPRRSQGAIPVPTSSDRINLIRRMNISSAVHPDTPNHWLPPDKTAVVSLHQTALGESSATASTRQQDGRLRSELVIANPGALAAASVLRLGEGSATLDALLGTMRVHVRVPSDVPCRRVFAHRSGFLCFLNNSTKSGGRHAYR